MPSRTGSWRLGSRDSFILIAVLWLAMLVAPASDASGWTLRVAGDVTHPLVLHDNDFLAMQRQTVTVTDEKGKKAVYEGVPIASLLQRAQAPMGSKLRGAAMKLYVVAEASDGYHVVFALPEFDPDFTNRVILLADRRDGHTLPSYEGPLRIVAPGDQRHARWARHVTLLLVQSAQ